MSVVVEDRFAIYAVDPGGTSGVAWGYFNAARSDGTIASVLARARRRERLRAHQLTGSPPAQVRAIMRGWREFEYRWNVELGQSLAACHLVVEGFALRQRNVDLAPILIIGGIEAMMYGSVFGFDFQSPSDAMTFATRERLRRWGLWVPGQEHARDANRHLALKVSKLLAPAPTRI